MAPRCLSPSQLGQIYKHHGGFRVQLNTSNRIVRGPGRPGYLRARQDLARARTCPSREAMVGFVSGGCRHENLPSDPETLRAEQTACFSSRRLCGKHTADLSQRRICGKRPPSFVQRRVSVALLRPRAEAKAAPALRSDKPPAIKIAMKSPKLKMKKTDMKAAEQIAIIMKKAMKRSS